jgi:hypothetical protein
VELIDVVLPAPVDVVPPHLLGVLEVELPGAQEAEQVGVVPPPVQQATVQRGGYAPELLQRLQLLLRAVAREARLGRRYPEYFFFSLFIGRDRIFRFIMEGSDL